MQSLKYAGTRMTTVSTWHPFGLMAKSKCEVLFHLNIIEKCHVLGNALGIPDMSAFGYPMVTEVHAIWSTLEVFLTHRNTCVMCYGQWQTNDIKIMYTGGTTVAQWVKKPFRCQHPITGCQFKSWLLCYWAGSNKWAEYLGPMTNVGDLGAHAFLIWLKRPGWKDHLRMNNLMEDIFSPTLQFLINKPFFLRI